MKIFTPFLVTLRIIIYSLLMFGVAEILRYDALHPMGGVPFGEISFTEITQEVLLFLMFILYLAAGRKYNPVQPVTNLIALFFLASFIREFNNFISWWFYPVLAVILVAAFLLVRNFSKLKQSVMTFFALPASGWFFSGILVTYIFSRLFGRKIFWKLLYDDTHYRLAKTAAEEGLELAGVVILLISTIELLVCINHLNKTVHT